MIELAAREQIPHQLEGHAAYITSDAAAIQYARRGGCPAVTLKVSMRYTHGPLESCSLEDIAATTRLLVAALGTLGRDTDLRFA